MKTQNNIYQNLNRVKKIFKPFELKLFSEITITKDLIIVKGYDSKGIRNLIKKNNLKLNFVLTGFTTKYYYFYNNDKTICVMIEKKNNK